MKFKQNPGGKPPRPPVFIEATNDADALEQVATRWTREDGVDAVHGLPGGRGSGTQYRVWIRL